MYKSIIVLSTLFAAAFAGQYEVCTGERDGSPCMDFQVTKDCCAEVNKNDGAHQKFWDVSGVCVADPLGSNGVDVGGMVECCESRGAGSREMTLPDQVFQPCHDDTAEL